MLELLISICGVLITALQTYNTWLTRRTDQKMSVVQEHAAAAAENAATAAKSAAIAHTVLSDKVDEILLRTEESGAS